MNISKNRVSPSEGHTSRMVVVSNEQGSNDRRDPWPCKIESLLALTAYNINVYALWSFPSYCFKNGGAAFFVPYILTVILCGMPLYMIEMMLGQHGGGGVVTIWQCIPIFKGIGFAAVFINFAVAVYYAVYAAWTVYYLAASFRSQLLWDDCDPGYRWTTTTCALLPFNCTDLQNLTFCPTNYNGTVHYHYGISPMPLQLTFSDNEWTNWNDSMNGSLYANISSHIIRPFWNWSDSFNESLEAVWRLPAHDYFENEVVHAPNTFIDARPEKPLGYESILCLLLVCIIIFFCLLRGAKSVGKACFVMVILSYLFMVIVLIRTIFAYSGAAMGLATYLYPDWTRLTDFHVWGDGALLAFFTLFPTWGAVANIGSHNHLGSRFREDCIIATLGSAVSNVFYGFTVAMLVGVLADTVGLTPLAFLTTGPNLIFVAVAQALSQLPVAPVWSSFLYISVLSVIMGTLLIITQTVVESVTRCCVPDQNARYWRPVFIAVVCCAMFLIGLGLVSKYGVHMMVIFDRYCNWWNTIVLAFIELVVLLIISPRFGNCNQGSSKCNRVLQAFFIFWSILAAIILILMLVYIFYPCIPFVMDLGSLWFPTWAEAIGWVLTVIPLAFVPILAIITIVQAAGDNLIQKVRNSLKPDPQWTQMHVTSLEVDEMVINRAPLMFASEDVETAPIVVRKVSSPSVEAAMAATVFEPAVNSSTVIVLPPPPEPAPRRPLRIAATEPAIKPGKINRGTQMTRDISIQTGNNDGDGAFVEYPEHFDHPEFMGIVTESKRHKKRKDKHRKKEKSNRKEKPKDDEDEGANLPLPPPVPKTAFAEPRPTVEEGEEHTLTLQ